MPNHNYECPDGHQFEAEVEWDLDRIPCQHIECKEEAERLWMAPRSPFRQLSTPITFWRYSDGSIGVAGGADSKTPKAAERLEIRSLGEYRQLVGTLNQQHRDRHNQQEERFLEMKERMEHQSRSNLSWAMGQESDPAAREIYREALNHGDRGTSRMPFREWFAEIAEMDSSNRDGGRGQRK